MMISKSFMPSVLMMAISTAMVGVVVVREEIQVHPMAVERIIQ
jgi:hypothetical protein